VSTIIRMNDYDEKIQLCRKYIASLMMSIIPVIGPPNIKQGMSRESSFCCLVRQVI